MDRARTTTRAFLEGAPVASPSSSLTRWRARLGRGFLSPDGAALMYAYDDLGADVVGAAPERLKPLFDTFRSWLLGHDMQRIRRAFAAGSELG